MLSLFMSLAHAATCDAFLDDGTEAPLLVSLDLDTGEVTTLVSTSGFAAWGVTGLHVDGDAAFACADGSLWRVSLLDGAADDLGVVCSSVGPGDDGALVATAFPRTLAGYATLDDATEGGGTSWTHPRRASRFATAGGLLYSSWHAGSTVQVSEDGETVDVLALEGFNGWVWGLDVVDDELYVLGDGRADGSGPHVAVFDAATGDALRDTPLSLYAQGEVRGLWCPRTL